MTAKRKSIKTVCKAKTKDGTGCRAAALPGSDFCFFHDPAKAEERRDAQSFGGSQNRMKTLSEDTPDAKIEDCQDVVALISETINQVRKGQVDPRIANSIGYLANILIKAIEQGDVEERLAEVEALVKARTSTDLTLMGTE